MKSRFRVLFVVFIILLLFIGISTVSSAKEPDGVSIKDTGWCTVSFYNRDELWYEERVPAGSSLASPVPSPQRSGYKFVAWESEAGMFDEGARIYSNIRYEAVYELLPPTFQISSLEFEYDGKGRELGFSEISHPYLSSGIISYEWFKDGVALGIYSPSVNVINVADSGYYTAKLSFSVLGDVATVITPPVSVKILKKEIAIPKIPQAIYSGNEIYPEIFDTGAYTVEKSSYIQTGTYPIKLTLRDSENYRFSGNDKPFIYVDFTINPAKNYFIDDLCINDIFTSGTPSPYALSRFGIVEYLYSASQSGLYSPNPPTSSGDYYVKAVVKATDCYSGIESDAVRFSVIEEVVTGIAINTNPKKLKYTAFDTLDKDGLSVSVSYNSGRSEIVYENEIDVAYMSADSLRYGDSGVILSYGGSSVVLLVDVLKANYDISGVSFSSFTAVYNGKVQSPPVSVSLPVGKDGIPLLASVEGGGIDVGRYQVALVFKTDSKNYNVPSGIYFEFVILPCEVSVCWGQNEFIYDGTPKLPSAFYIDLNGRRVAVSTVGERTNAGSYTASATQADPNYTLSNPTVGFRILKAAYDTSGIVWQGGGEKYDGGKKQVSLSNLPSGVLVIGYVNATAVNCGSYTATATVSYDDKNYEPPEIPEYDWEILPGEYDLSGFEFLDNVAEYSGGKNYPILSGAMPVGGDGFALEYEFIGYAENVSDGEVTVEVRFFSGSSNYNVPDSIFRTVSVIPKGISVDWHSLHFVYTGAVNLPYAVSEYTTVNVTGGQCDAGEYSASATSDNCNYYVVNHTVIYTVSPAANFWITPPEISDIFFGEAPSPFAFAKGGDAVFRYYSDPECKEQLSDIPSEVGEYYLIAEASGGKNYLPISSSPIKFRIVAVVPTGIEVLINRGDFVALDLVGESDFSAYLCYNNGDKAPIKADEVRIIYANADRLIFGDRALIFEYKGFSTECRINVIKRSFDLSEVRWCDTFATYDGTAKYASLTGLPEGLEVISYVGNGKTSAGQYMVSAELKYDQINYMPPDIEDAILTVMKQTVPTPIIQPAEYDGTVKSPTVPTDSRYIYSFLLSGKNSGSYSVSFSLVDRDNYCFENGGESISVDFVILPRTVEITLSDVDVYLFERESDIRADWSVTAGNVIAGDDLGIRFFIEGDRIFAASDNANYHLSVIPADVHRHALPSPYVISSFMLVFSILLVLALVSVLIFVNRRRIRAGFVAYSANSANAEVLFAPAVDVAEETAGEEVCEPQQTDAPASPMAVSVDYAESAITNSLAKDLIRHDDNVATCGNKRGIVNVDTLSRSFEAGERVDINALKNKSLIPYDTGYVKVLARGIIDKPLYVYANDFSLAAVKMIALTGGKAIKVNTTQRNKGYNVR